MIDKDQAIREALRDEIERVEAQLVGLKAVAATYGLKDKRVDLEAHLGTVLLTREVRRDPDKSAAVGKLISAMRDARRFAESVLTH